MTTMRQLIESRIAEYGPEFAPATSYGQPDWLSYGYEFSSPAVEIADDGNGNQAWADDECVLYSYANGGEELRDRDEVCKSVRAVYCDDEAIKGMYDDELWGKIVNREVAPW